MQSAFITDDILETGKQFKEILENFQRSEKLCTPLMNRIFSEMCAFLRAPELSHSYGLAFSKQKQNFSTSLIDSHL